MRRILMAGIIGVMMSTTIHTAVSRPSSSYSQSRSSSHSSYKSSYTPSYNRSSNGYGGSNNTHSTSVDSDSRNQMMKNSGSALNRYQDSKAPVSAGSPAYTSNPGYTPSTSDHTYQPPVINHYHDYHDNNSGFFTGMIAGSILSHHDDHPVIINNGVPNSTVVNNGSPNMTSNAYIPSQHHYLRTFFEFLFWIAVLAILGYVAYRLITRRLVNKAIKKDNEMTPINGFRVGNSITVPTLASMNDPNATTGLLHFEPTAKGNTTIVGIATHQDDSNTDLYLNDEDFVRLYDNKRSARLFSLIDQVIPANEQDWDQWLNDSTGIMGSATFMTPDNTEWARTVFPDNANRVKPETHLETYTDNDSVKSRRFAETLYKRDTGFGNGFAGVEYLLVRIRQTSDDASIDIYAGVDVNPSDLKLG